MPPSRRALLRGVSGIAALAVAGSTGSTADTTDSVAVDAAAGWSRRALWTDSGFAAEFPGQVVYPSDSAFALRALGTFDARDRAADREVAAASVPLQDPDTGGFLGFFGDVRGPWVSDTYGAVLLADRHGLDIDREAAVEFLQDMQATTGGFSPRYSVTGGRIEERMAATARALRALDRLDALDETTATRASAFLRSQQNPQGGWPPVANGARATVGGTYFAVDALRTLGELDAATRRRATAFLSTVQQPDGGFRTTVNPVRCGPSNAPVSTNCDVDPEVTSRATARGILTFRKLGELDGRRAALRAAHADWLLARQRTDPDDPRFAGGFETYADSDAPVVDFRTNTRLALRALDALDAEFDPTPGVDFLLRCQHEGSHGFAAWPSAIASLEHTDAAVRALGLTGGDQPAAALAATLADQQGERGDVRTLDWSFEPNTAQTARALAALARVGRLDAVDVDAAAGFVAARQQDSGGFAPDPRDRSDVAPHVTGLALRGLAAAGELDRVDAPAVGAYYRDLQRDNGRLTDASHEYGATRDTALALAGLAALGRTGDVDRDAAAGFLAGYQRSDGSYVDPGVAGRVVLGLDAVGELDRIDTAATASFLADSQRSTGGFAARAFYLEGPAAERHAVALAALEVLGALPDEGDGDDGGDGCERGPPSDAPDDAPACPGGSARSRTVGAVDAADVLAVASERGLPERLSGGGWVPRRE